MGLFGARLADAAQAAVGAGDKNVSIPVFRYDGPVWGPGYDSGDLNEMQFGTITVRFPTCDTALFSIQSNGPLQSGDYSLVRLTNVEGVDCKEPVEPPPSGIRTGRWEGQGVCFNVSSDGTTIIGGELSSCDQQSAFDGNLDGISNDGRNCKATPSCEGVWPIIDGTFTCVNEFGEMAIGTFDSNTSASGWGFEGEGGRGEFCAGNWTASPD